MTNKSAETEVAYFVVQRMPGGEAPEYIRRAWLDLVLPIEPVPVEAPQSVQGRGIISQESAHLENAVAVSLKSALSALDKAGRPEAAEWWIGTAVRTYLDYERRLERLLFDAKDGIIITKNAKERFYPDSP